MRTKLPILVLSFAIGLPFGTIFGRLHYPPSLAPTTPTGEPERPIIRPGLRGVIVEVEQLPPVTHLPLPHLAIDIHNQGPGIEYRWHHHEGARIVSSVFARKVRARYVFPEGEPETQCFAMRWQLLIEVFPEEAERLALAKAYGPLVAVQNSDDWSGRINETLLTGERAKALGVDRGRMIRIVKGLSGETWRSPTPSPAATGERG